MNPPGSSSDKPQLFVKDVSRSEAFFTETLGFVKTEEVAHKGHAVSICAMTPNIIAWAIFPKQLRAELGLSLHTGAAISSNTRAVRVRAIAINAGYPSAIETANESARIKFL